MPEKETIRRAAKKKREGKQPTTQAGEFVREEMHHIREGKRGATSQKQAIAIGLSKARRAGVKLGPPKKRAASKPKASSSQEKSKTAGRSGSSSRARRGGRRTTRKTASRSR